MSEYPEIAGRFKRATARHQMTVVRDEGLYRHLQFVNPTSPLYWFEIVTSPGQLVFSGDGASFVFRLTGDMFEMFRRSAESGSINATYWAEKCRTGNARSYSRERFEQHVWEQVAASEKYYRNLRDDVQAEIFDGDQFNVDYEADALMAVLGYTGRFAVSRNAQGNWDNFYFRGVHEWELKDFDWWFLFACYAISDSIVKYDATKAVSA